MRALFFRQDASQQGRLTAVNLKGDAHTIVTSNARSGGIGRSLVIGGGLQGKLELIVCRTVWVRLEANGMVALVG